MIRHSYSQMDDAEINRLLGLTLASSNASAALVHIDSKAYGRSEMLQYSVLTTPEGPIYRVADINVVDGKPLDEEFYRDERDADSVWEQLLERVEARSRPPVRQARA